MKKKKELQANSGSQRLSINGALNIKRRDIEVLYSKSVNERLTITFFNKIETLRPDSKRIAGVADNVKYYYCKLFENI